MKFRVKNGRHVDEAGTVYTKGEIVSNDADLRKAFPEKFVLVGSEQESELIETESEVQEDEDSGEKPKPKRKNTWAKKN